MGHIPFLVGGREQQARVLKVGQGHYSEMGGALIGSGNSCLGQRFVFRL